MGEGTFCTEFTVHLVYDKGTAVFAREEQLPFVPFVGLDILDDILGEFKLAHVAWHSGTRMFLCQANVKCAYWDIRTAVREMAGAGWAEDKEAREVNGE